MKPIRFGIIGCGGIAGTHAECLKELAEEGVATLVAGADTDREHAKAFAKRWHIPVHPKVKDLVARRDIDAVAVCSPSGLHCDHGIAAMQAGKHALLEKPMDLWVHKVDAAIAAAKENKVVLGGIFQQRFTPGAQKVKKAIDEGYFGKIVMVHCETPWYRAQEYYDSGEWRGTWDLDCGVLSNQAPHMIDRLIWLGGDVEEVVSAVIQPGLERSIQAETNGVAIIRLKNGAIGTITGSTLAYGSIPQHVLICGTEGSASFVADDLTNFETMRPFEYEDTVVDKGGFVEDTSKNPLAIWSNSHKNNIRDFALAIREGRAPAVTGEDGRKLVRVLNLIYEKAGVGPYAKN